MDASTRIVLAVDDETDLLVTYGRLLQRRGYGIVTASSRAEGLRALEEQSFALVIADVRLADGDGLDVVRAASGGARPTPAIVVAGFSSDAARKRALAAGAAAYLPKPFTVAALTSLIDQFLLRH
jgi:DNA-binding response OmpR family regulator